MAREVEELWHLLGSTSGMTRVRETTIRGTELIEERVNHGVDGGKTLSRSVLKKRGDQIDSILGGFPEYLHTSQHVELLLTIEKIQEVRIR